MLPHGIIRFPRAPADDLPHILFPRTVRQRTVCRILRPFQLPGDHYLPWQVAQPKHTVYSRRGAPFQPPARFHLPEQLRILCRTENGYGHLSRRHVPLMLRCRYIKIRITACLAQRPLIQGVMRVLVFYDIVHAENTEYLIFHLKPRFPFQDQIVRPRRLLPQYLFRFYPDPAPVPVHVYPQKRLKPRMPVAARHCLQFLQFRTKLCYPFLFLLRRHIIWRFLCPAAHRLLPFRFLLFYALRCILPLFYHKIFCSTTISLWNIAKSSMLCMTIIQRWLASLITVCYPDNFRTLRYILLPQRFQVLSGTAPAGQPPHILCPPGQACHRPRSPSRWSACLSPLHGAFSAAILPCPGYPGCPQTWPLPGT